MTAVFVKILNMSLTAGYCIVAVIVLRFLLRKQAKILSYLLWSVVLFRLLVPFSFVSGYSLLLMDTAVVSRESLADAEKTTGTVWHGKGYILDEPLTGEGMGAMRRREFLRPSCSVLSARRSICRRIFSRRNGSMCWRMRGFTSEEKIIWSS